MIYNYLLDSNVYNILRKTPNALKAFNISIRNSEAIPYSNIMLRMTPYSLMEAIGFTIDSPQIEVPKSILSSRNTKEVFFYILKQSKEIFLEKLDRNVLLEKAKEQSLFTLNQQDSKYIEYSCIYKPLNDLNIEENFAENLAFDYAFKYNFSSDFEFDLYNNFFISTFFTTDKFISKLSKFRLTKKFWDQIYLKTLESNKDQQDLILNLNKSMRLKKSKDFLDCDIIHLVTTGDFNGEEFRPTIAFTCDDGQTIVNRVMIYKTHIEQLKNNLDENIKPMCLGIIDRWQEGILVFCNRDGTIKDFINVNEIQPIFT